MFRRHPSSARSVAITGTGTRSLTNLTVRVSEPAAEGEHLRLEIEPMASPAIGPGQCLIEVSAAGVNASDVEATLGQMPLAVWPRTPGRDYAGFVREGPGELIGKEVWEHAS